MNEKIKKSVDYKILIKSGRIYFDVGTMVIKIYSGDILYTPSTRFLDDLNNKNKKEIDHLSWHASGRVHIKIKEKEIKKYLVIQRQNERQKISEIGFQEMLKDAIQDFQALPRYQKVATNLDVVLDAGDYTGPVLFNFSIVSGRLIVAKYQGQKIPIKPVNIKKERDGLDSTIRALGYHSGSGDVLLQYSLRKNTNVSNPLTNRQIFIPYDMKISKLNVKL